MNKGTRFEPLLPIHRTMDRSNTNAVQPIPPAAAAEDIKALAHVLNTALKSKLNVCTTLETVCKNNLFPAGINWGNEREYTPNQVPLVRL